jgi:predicted O-methyltransferase YrrM
MDSVNPQVEGYIASLLDRYDEPVLLEMEAEGRDRGFPIIGRLCGVWLELLARSVGARRVFELGSGFGYSAYWFARATGPGGEVHGTDGDPAHEAQALGYLGRAGLGERIRWHVGDALESLAIVGGEFDVVFCDIDKTSYPDAWRAARERIRIGGLYLCDNTIGFGGGTVFDEGESPAAIREHNRLIAEDERYESTILPTREGVMVALRIG